MTYMQNYPIVLISIILAALSWEYDTIRPYVQEGLLFNPEDERHFAAAIEAAKMQQAGKSYEEVVEKIQGEMQESARIFFTIPMPIQDFPVTESQINSVLVLITIFFFCLYTVHNIKLCMSARMFVYSNIPN